MAMETVHVRKANGAISGDRPEVVVLLHGLGSSSAVFIPLAKDIQAAGYSVLAIDLPGHGQSSPLQGRVTIERMAQSIATVITRECPGQAVHVVGLQTGGCIALTLAVERPEIVRSLVLSNTYDKFRPRPGSGGGLRELTKRLSLMFCVTTGPGETPMSPLAKHVARTAFPADADASLREEMAATVAQTPRGVYLEGMRAIAAFDFRKRAPLVDCPCLIVTGTHDTVLASKCSEKLHRLIPRSRLLVVPGGGHAIPLGSPSVFTPALLDFLGTASQAAAMAEAAKAQARVTAAVAAALSPAGPTPAVAPKPRQVPIATYVVHVQ